MSEYRTTFLTAPKTIVMETAERPKPGEGEVLIQMSAVGICGSDIHWYLEGGIGASKVKSPITLGHEPAGVVVEVGSGVDSSLRGKRVAIEPGITCCHCEYCLRGDTNLCPNVKFMGSTPIHGAFREFVTHPARLVVPLPDSISDGMGALLEPLAIALHVADLLKPKLAQPVVIQGAGPIGLTCMLAMKLYGPSKIVVVDPVEYRREIAKEMGADVVFSSDDPDVEREVERATHGGGKYVIEAVGCPQSFDQMVRFASPGAKIAQVGIDAHDRFSYNHGIARRKGVTVYMVRRSRPTVERAIELTLGNKWQPQPLITHRMGLDKVGDAMEMVANYRDGVMKAIIDPRQ